MAEDTFWDDLQQKYVQAGVDLERISGILQRTGTRVPYDRMRIFRTLGRAEVSGVFDKERLEVWAGFDVSVFLNANIWPGGPDGTGVEDDPYWLNAQKFMPEELLVLARGASLTVPMRTLRLLRRGVSPEMLTALPMVGMSEQEYLEAMEVVGHIPPAWLEGVVGFFDEPDMATQIIGMRQFRQFAELFDEGIPAEYAQEVLNPLGRS